MKTNRTTISAGDAEMPMVGLGMWQIERESTPGVVVNAMQAGYRHIDIAADYGNEVETGVGIARALSDGICQREDLWVTSKLWNTCHRPEHVGAACDRTLSDLKLDYLDLYLVHFPIATRFVPFDHRYPPGWVFDPEVSEPRMEFDDVPLAETWSAMEELVREGRVRQIGVCNYNTGLLRDLMAYCNIKPSVLQIESHPFLTQEKLIKLAKSFDIAVTAFSPLGALAYIRLEAASLADSVLTAAPVREAASRLGKTPAQIVLRWGVQRGTAIIPKTSRAERLRENIALFDFELSDNEMDAISALNRNPRFNDPGEFCEQKFGSICPIYD